MNRCAMSAGPAAMRRWKASSSWSVGGGHRGVRRRKKGPDRSIPPTNGGALILGRFCLVIEGQASKQASTQEHASNRADRQAREQEHASEQTDKRSSRQASRQTSERAGKQDSRQGQAHSREAGKQARACKQTDKHSMRTMEVGVVLREVGLEHGVCLGVVHGHLHHLFCVRWVGHVRMRVCM